MTDKQRIIRLESALKHALKALKPMTTGTYWINRANVAAANRAIERANKALTGVTEP